MLVDQVSLATPGQGLASLGCHEVEGIPLCDRELVGRGSISSSRFFD